MKLSATVDGKPVLIVGWATVEKRLHAIVIGLNKNRFDQVPLANLVPPSLPKKLLHKAHKWAKSEAKDAINLAVQ